MAPFHPVRYEARAFTARALALAAIFCAIAIVLLAGSTPGAAEAKDKESKNSSETVVQVETGAPAPAPEESGKSNGKRLGSRRRRQVGSARSGGPDHAARKRDSHSGA